MAKKKFSVQSLAFETYVVDVPDDIKDGAKMEEYFYNLEDHSQFLVDSESFQWQIDSIEQT